MVFTREWLRELHLRTAFNELYGLLIEKKYIEKLSLKLQCVKSTMKIPIECDFVMLCGTDRGSHRNWFSSTATTHWKTTINISYSETAAGKPAREQARIQSNLIRARLHYTFSKLKKFQKMLIQMNSWNLKYTLMLGMHNAFGMWIDIYWCGWRKQKKIEQSLDQTKTINRCCCCCWRANVC